MLGFQRRENEVWKNKRLRGTMLSYIYFYKCFHIAAKLLQTETLISEHPFHSSTLYPTYSFCFDFGRVLLSRWDHTGKCFFKSEEACKPKTNPIMKLWMMKLWMIKISTQSLIQQIFNNCHVLGTVLSAGDTIMIKPSHCSPELTVQWGRETRKQILNFQTMTSAMKKNKAG